MSRAETRKLRATSARPIAALIAPSTPRSRPQARITTGATMSAWRAMWSAMRLSCATGTPGAATTVADSMACRPLRWPMAAWYRKYRAVTAPRKPKSPNTMRKSGPVPRAWSRSQPRKPKSTGPTTRLSAWLSPSSNAAGLRSSACSGVPTPLVFHRPAGPTLRGRPDLLVNVFANYPAHPAGVKPKRTRIRLVEIRPFRSTGHSARRVSRSTTSPSSGDSAGSAAPSPRRCPRRRRTGPARSQPGTKKA